MSKLFNYWDIVHVIYPNYYGIKDSYGIVFDNLQKGKPYWKWGQNSPIMGYLNWKDGSQEFVDIGSERSIAEYQCVAHKANPITNEIIEGLRYNAYLMNKRRLLDNLSLIEILDKLNEYNSRIS